MAGKVFQVDFTLAAKLGSSFGKAFAGAGKSSDILNNKIKALDANQKKLTGFVTLKKELRSTGVELKNAQAEVARLAREIKATPKPTKKLQAEFARAKKKAAGLKNSIQKQNISLHKLRQGMSQAGLATSNLTGQQSRLAAALAKTKKAQANLQRIQMKQQAIRGRRSALRGQMFGAVAVAAGFAAPIAAAVKFESKMADVRKVVDFDTPQQFKQMGKDILKLTTSGGIPMAAGQIAEIIAAAGQAGIAEGNKELLEFGATAAKMGVAFDLEGGAAGKMMANWRAGMDLTQDKATSLGDAVNHLSNNMNANAGALGEVLQRTGAVTKAAGLNEIQTAALAAAMLSSGAAPERVSTSIKKLTGVLTKGTAATATQQEAFAALGLDAEEMAERMQEDAVGAINDVFRLLAEAPKEKQGALMSQLFGERIEVIAPLIGNLKLLDKAQDLTAKKTNYLGSMQKEYEERAKTTANSLQLMMNRVTRLGVSVGGVLLPPLNAVLGVAGPIVETLAWATDKFPGISTVIIGTGAALAGLNLALIAGKYAWTFVHGGYLAVKKIAAITKIWTGAQWVLNAAMNANPIGLVIAGAVALGAAAIVIYKNWEPIKNFFVDIGNWFANISWFDAGSKLVSSLAGGIMAGISAPVDAIGAVLGKVRDFLPFSDAKTGPLSGLTESGRKMVETFGAGASRAAPTFAKSPGMKGGGGRSVTLHFSQTINLPPGASAQVKEKVEQGILAGREGLKKAIQEIIADDARLSYG